MLVTPKDKNVINSERYYIKDNNLDKFIEVLTKWKTGKLKNEFVHGNSSEMSDEYDLGTYIKLFKMNKNLLVIDSATKVVLPNREQKYYRIYNGDEIFWGEQEDFEEV